MASSDDKSARRRNALGRGLGALIPNEDDRPKKKRTFVNLPIDRVAFARIQPRADFDQARIAELAASIEESGLIQPLVVREKQGRYELIAGERRLRACRLAGLKEVPAVIKDVSDTDAYTLALIENIQREDLNPVEEALAFKKLLDDTGSNQTDLAARLGKSRSALANSIRLLDLPDQILDFLITGEISAGHARALIPLDRKQAFQLAEKIAEEGWSVRRTEEEVRKLKDGPAEKKPATSRYRDDALVRDLTERLQHRLGTRVKLKDREGKGRIEIYYDDVDVLQSVLDRIFEDD